MTWLVISGLIVGALLGFVMQRTRFCLAGGFRDMYVQKSNKMFYALLIAISVQSIGLLILTSTGLVEIPESTYPNYWNSNRFIYIWYWYYFIWRLCYRYVV